MMADRWLGLAVAALSLLFMLIAVPSISDQWRTTQGSEYFTIGPQFFPYIAGTLCLLLGLAIAARPGTVLRLDGWRVPEARRGVVMAIALGAIYMIAIAVAGFVVSSSLMILAFLWCFNFRRWTVAMPLALILPAGLELFFFRVFTVELPAGWLNLTLAGF